MNGSGLVGPEVTTLGDGEPVASAAGLRAGEALGRFTLIRPLGHGAMGEVWAARDAALDREVALKLLRLRPGGLTSEDKTRLRREAQAMARLHHPNVVAIYELGTDGDRVFCAMELIDGTTLRRWLATPRRWREVMDIACAAGAGVAAAHAAGLVHRDIKPENLMIETGGRAVVSDFGLAKLVDLGDGDELAAVDRALGPEPRRPGALTATGAVLGTPVYMAPEQLAGRRADARSDQFSYCVTTYEALFGVRPFLGDSIDQLVEAIRQGPRRPARLRGAPAAVMRGLVRGLAAEPAARWPSMEILVERLREATRRPHRIRIAAVAAGAVAAAVIAIVLAASRVPDPFAAERAAAEQRIAAWNPAQARALAQAFAATHAPRAAEHASAVIERLDRYRASWLAARLDAWSATHVRHAQPARDLELRIACYDRLAAAMTGAVAALLAPGADDITAKIHTVDQLESIAICSQLDRLIELSTVPTNAAGDALEKQVDALEAKQNSGHIAEVLDQAQQLVASAQRVGGPGQLARARYILGISQIEVGSSEDAARTLRLALQDAAVARDHYLVARVWVRLVTVTGQNLGRLDEAIAMIPAAQAAIAQASDDLNLRAQFAEAELVLSYTRGDLVAALDYGGQALDLFTGSQGPRSDGVFNAETNLGIICAERGELDEAVRHLEAARKLATEIYGAHHPSIGYVEDALAVVARKRHDLAGAERHERAAIAISAAAHGPDNEVTAEFRVNLVDLLARRHRLAEARAELARARTSYRQALPAESAEVIMLDVREAQLAEAEGHARDAVRLARPAIERLRHTSVPAVKLAEALRRLARMVAHDQPGDALPIYDEAIRLGRERKPPDIAEDVELLNGAADAAERAHRPAAALPWFTRMPEAANQLSGRLHRLLAEAAR